MLCYNKEMEEEFHNIKIDISMQIKPKKDFRVLPNDGLLNVPLPGLILLADFPKIMRFPHFALSVWLLFPMLFLF